MAAFFALAGILISIGLFGCRDNCPIPDKKGIIATVNDYEITVDDLNKEAVSDMGALDRSKYSEDAKKAVLDQMITESLLIQEAQKQGFDRDRAFMKEIERYWKQALIKFLIRKKSAELQDTEGLDRWIEGLRKRSDIKIYVEDLNKAKAK